MKGEALLKNMLTPYRGLTNEIYIIQAVAHVIDLYHSDVRMEERIGLIMSYLNVADDFVKGLVSE